MIITVTREDIQRGKRGDAGECPVGLALQRVLNRPVEVWSHQVVLLGRGPRVVVPLPWSVQHWIIRFDTGVIRKATAPSFDFELDWDDAHEVEVSGFDGDHS